MIIDGLSRGCRRGMHVAGRAAHEIRTGKMPRASRWRQEADVFTIRTIVEARNFNLGITYAVLFQSWRLGRFLRWARCAGCDRRQCRTWPGLAGRHVRLEGRGTRCRADRRPGSPTAHRCFFRAEQTTTRPVRAISGEQRSLVLPFGRAGRSGEKDHCRQEHDSL